MSGSGNRKKMLGKEDNLGTRWRVKSERYLSAKFECNKANERKEEEKREEICLQPADRKRLFVNKKCKEKT